MGSTLHPPLSDGPALVGVDEETQTAVDPRVDVLDGQLLERHAYLGADVEGLAVDQVVQVGPLEVVLDDAEAAFNCVVLGTGRGTEYAGHTNHLQLLLEPIRSVARETIEYKGKWLVAHLPTNLLDLCE